MSELIAAAERAMRVKRCPFCTYDHTIGPLCKYAGEHIAQVAALAAEQPQDALPVFVLYKGPRTMLHAKVLGVHFDETQTVVTIETPPAPAEQPQPVAWLILKNSEPVDTRLKRPYIDDLRFTVRPLYTAPPPPAAAPIEVTDAMIEAAWKAMKVEPAVPMTTAVRERLRASIKAGIEAALAAREGR